MSRHNQKGNGKWNRKLKQENRILGKIKETTNVVKFPRHQADNNHRYARR